MNTNQDATFFQNLTNGDSSQNNQKTLNNKPDNKNSIDDNINNIRIENSLSLRKKKINELFLSKRLKGVDNISDSDESDFKYIDIKKVKSNLPNLLTEEFEIYDEKLNVIHQFLNKDYTLLHGLPFDENCLIEYLIYELIDLTHKESDEIYNEKYENYLILVFEDIINLLKSTKDKKLIYGITTVLVNFMYGSNILINKFREKNLWNILAEISELKIDEINDNIIYILNNIISSVKEIGKEYVLSNYSRYIKQMIINVLKTFILNSPKKNFDLNLYTPTISLIKRLTKIKNDDFDVVMKLKQFNEFLTKIFQICTSWILNNDEFQSHEKILKFILQLTELFSVIATYADSDTYKMQEFRGEAFVVSFCSLLKFLITKKEKKVDNEIIICVLNEIYNFIGILFCILGPKETEIYSQEKIIILTEEFLKNEDISKDLCIRIIFFLSNYAENKERSSEIVINNNIILYLKNFYIKNNSLKEDSKFCYNLFYLIGNLFMTCENKQKEELILNFGNFIVERIKTISSIIINNNANEKDINNFMKKCVLLKRFVIFLRDGGLEYLNTLKYFIDYIRLSNLEQCLNDTKIKIDENYVKEIDMLIKEIK